MPTKMTARGLVSFAWCVLGSLLLVVLWGAVVRATGSGAGCGDGWPLCNGDFVPHHPRLATIIEFTHRSSSGFSGTLTILVAAWIFLAKGRGHPAWRAAIWTVVFVLLEAGLGAVLVLRKDVVDNASTERVVMQVIHFSNTLLLMGSMTLTAWFLGRRSAARDGQITCGAHKILAAVAVTATMITGATGSLAALADTLFPSPTLMSGLVADFAASSPLLVRMRWMHPAVAVVALVCAVMLGMRMRSFAARALLALTAAQLLLGRVERYYSLPDSGVVAGVSFAGRGPVLDGAGGSDG